MSDVNVVNEEQSSSSNSFVIRMVANVLGKLIDRNTNVQVIVYLYIVYVLYMYFICIVHALHCSWMPLVVYRVRRIVYYSNSSLPTSLRLLWSSTWIGSGATLDAVMHASSCR